MLFFLLLLLFSDDFEEIKQDISSFRYEMLNVMRNRESQMSDVHTALSKINSQMLALREDMYGSNSNAPSLRTAKDKVLAQERKKVDGKTINGEGVKTVSRTMSGASDDDYSSRDGLTTSDSRQDSLGDSVLDPVPDDMIASHEQVQIDSFENEQDGKLSDDEECIIVHEENQKM